MKDRACYYGGIRNECRGCNLNPLRESVQSVDFQERT